MRQAKSLCSQRRRKKGNKEVSYSFCSVGARRTTTHAHTHTQTFFATLPAAVVGRHLPVPKSSQQATRAAVDSVAS